MMMNRKANLGLAIMTGLFVLIVGLMAVNYIMPEIITFRINMNCANADQITDGAKLVCLMADATIPYWIVAIFAVAIGGITAKLSL